MSVRQVDTIVTGEITFTRMTHREGWDNRYAGDLRLHFNGFLMPDSIGELIEWLRAHAVVKEPSSGTPPQS